jgi:hypothetical protein
MLSVLNRINYTLLWCRYTYPREIEIIISARTGDIDYIVSNESAESHGVPVPLMDSGNLSAVFTPEIQLASFGVCKGMISSNRGVLTHSNALTLISNAFNALEC